jgi:enolase
MSRISSISTHEILDSRGDPTIRVHMALDNYIRECLRNSGGQLEMQRPRLHNLAKESIFSR